MSLSLSIQNVYVFSGEIDFRKSWNGLHSLALAEGVDPYQKNALVFVHKNRRSLKILYGDDLGLFILMRRFEGGCLEKLAPSLLNEGMSSISCGELQLLIEGATYSVSKRVKPLR